MHLWNYPTYEITLTVIKYDSNRVVILNWSVEVKILMGNTCLENVHVEAIVNDEHACNVSQVTATSHFAWFLMLRTIVNSHLHSSIAKVISHIRFVLD